MSKNNSKLNYAKTFLVGFGFLSTSIAWSVYNANVPLMLAEKISSVALIGLIMSIDNIFAVIFQPVFGALSDRTKSKYGRRKPFIFFGIPICALFFTLIPAAKSVGMMMLVVILFNFTMSIWRTPIISLMPDLTPEEHRSKANGIINLMGGIGAILAYAGGGLILNKSNNNFQMVFIAAAIVMMVAWIVLIPVKEPTLGEIQAIKKEKSTVNKKDVNKQLLFILFAIFFWFVGHNTLETFFTLYATEALGVAAGDASLILTVFSLMFAIFAVPAGFIGEKIGRKKTIMIGIAVEGTIFFLGFFLKSFAFIRVGLIIAGIGWACININSLPMVLELAGEEKIGTFTGFYYAASQSAAVVAPTLFGLINDYITHDMNSMLLFSAIAYVGAFICMLFVKGKAKPEKLVSV